MKLLLGIMIFFSGLVFAGDEQPEPSTTSTDSTDWIFTTTGSGR